MTRKRDQLAVEAVLDHISPEILDQCLYLYRADVLDVTDGDTARITMDVGDGFKRDLICRFYGVNTPEISKPTDEGEREAGEAARDWLIAELIANQDKYGRNYVRTFRDKRGKFGRLLIEFLGFRGAHVYSINRALVDQGHAVPYLLGPKSVAPTWLLNAVEDYEAHCAAGGDRWTYMRSRADAFQAAS